MTSFSSPLAIKKLSSSLTLLALLAQIPQAQDAPKVKAYKNSASNLTLTVTETLIGRNSSEILEDSFLQGPNGQSVVYVVMSGGAMRVHRDNVPGAPFDGISLDTLHFSHDGQHLAYMAIRENQNVLVLDGKEFIYDAVTQSAVQFSPDSQHATWVIKAKDDKQALVFDGVEQLGHDGISPDGVTYSADGEHYVYQVSDGELTALVLDGVPGPHVESILTYGFSPDGSRLGYIAISGEQKLIFIDGELVAQVDGIGKGGLRFTASGDRYFLAVRRGEIWSMLIDGEFEGEYVALIPNYKVRYDGKRYAYLASPETGAGLSLYVNGELLAKQKGIQSLAFNPVTDDMAYVYRIDSLTHTVINGVTSIGYQSIERKGISFSLDGKHYAFSARLNDNHVVVLDGKASKPFDRYGPVQPTFLDNGVLVYTAVINGAMRFVFNEEHQIAFGKVNALFVNNDNSHHAYIAHEGTRRIAVVDGERNGEYLRIPKAPIFSNDGQSYTYVGQTGNKHEVIRNGKIKGSYDYVMDRSLNFTPDSKHLVYLAASGPERMLMFDDIQVSDNYTGFLRLRNLTFTDGNRFYVRASRGNDMLLLTCEYSSN